MACERSESGSKRVRGIAGGVLGEAMALSRERGILARAASLAVLSCSFACWARASEAMAIFEVLDSSVRVRRLPTTHFDLRDGVESLGVAGVGKLLLPPCALDLGGTAVDARRVAPLLAQHGIMQGGGGARGPSGHHMIICAVRRER